MCSAGLRPMRAATLAALQLLVLAAPACRADVDPDADPSRTPRVRAPPGGGPVAARAAFNGGGVAAADSSPLAFALSLPPDPIQSLRCAGGSAIAFSLDASSSIVPVEFAEMQSEVRLDVLHAVSPDKQAAASDPTSGFTVAGACSAAQVSRLSTRSERS